MSDNFEVCWLSYQINAQPDGVVVAHQLTVHQRFGYSHRYLEVPIHFPTPLRFFTEGMLRSATFSLDFEPTSFRNVYSKVSKLFLNLGCIDDRTVSSQNVVQIGPLSFEYILGTH